MSKLDELGGTKVAAGIAQQYRRHRLPLAADTIDALIARVEELETENQCDACVGAGTPLSGGTCICAGTGKMSAAATHLRSALVQMEAEIEPLRELREMVIRYYGNLYRHSVASMKLLKKAREAEEAAKP